MPIVQVYQIAHDGDVSSSTEKLGSKLKRQESLSPNVVKIYGQEAAFLLKRGTALHTALGPLADKFPFSRNRLKTDFVPVSHVPAIFEPRGEVFTLADVKKLQLMTSFYHCLDSHSSHPDATTHR
jgi:hypothetical protein